jgi:hypothetical protein
VRARRLAVATGLALVVPSVVGIVAVAAGAHSSQTDGAPAMAGATTEVSTSTAAQPPLPSTSIPASEPPSTASAPTTTTMTTTTTMAPIPTHDARVGVGVLTPVAVDAPVRVQIPSIASDGAVEAVGVDASGGLAIPGDAGALVWWRFGPSPGEPGSAVIAGHLDWKGKRGVFNRLADVKAGDPVTVTYAGGSTRAFVVDTVELVEKPAAAVNGTFARDGVPLLRLVTCGGEFDRASHHYRSNVVVTAHPV